jgi:gluconolactonase
MKKFTKAGAVLLLMSAMMEIHYPTANASNLLIGGNGKDSIRNDSASLFTGNQVAPKLISDQFSFTEGASADRKGNVYFTDQPNNKIWKYDVNGQLSVFKDNAGRSNGMYFDHKGNLISCADEQDQLWSISPEGKVTVLVKDLQGHRLNGPNDVWVNDNGDIYFTDPYYQRDYWNRTHSDLDGEKVYRLAKGSHEPVAVASDLQKPNGIVGTPDGKYLYVADINANKTYKYRIAPDGTLTDKTLFIAKGADGITLDDRGNLYLSGNGVFVVNPQGAIITHIAVPQPWTANLCFGGKHKNVLFITASKAIYVLPMNVHGVE